MATLSIPKTPKDKPNKKENNDWDQGDNSGETYGNEPPVRDPKPARNPDAYEMV